MTLQVFLKRQPRSEVLSALLAKVRLPFSVRLHVRPEIMKMREGLGAFATAVRLDRKMALCMSVEVMLRLKRLPAVRTREWLHLRVHLLVLRQR